MIIHSPIISGSLSFAEGGTISLPAESSFSGSFLGDVNATNDLVSGSSQIIFNDVTENPFISSSSSITASGHLVPSEHETYDLGSPTFRWRDLYLSGSTIDLGGTKISATSGELEVTDSEGAFIPIISSEVKIKDAVSGDVVILSVSEGALNTTATDSEGTPQETPSSNLSGSFTGSFDGVIKSTNGVVSGSQQVIDLLPTGTVSGSSQTIDNLPTGTVSGSIQILGGSTVLSSSAQNFTEFSSSVASTFAGLSTDYNDLQNIPSGIISSSNENFTSYSSSVDSRILIEKGRIDSILDSADADKDSFAEIVSLINSVDTTNDTAFASFYTSSNNTNDAQDARLTSLEAETGSITTEQSTQDSRLSNLESTTASIDTAQTAQDSRLSNLESTTASIDTAQTAQDSRLSNLESVTSSYQATLSVSDTTNVDMILSSDTLSANLKGGVVSGSIQILGGSTVLSSSAQNFTEFSSSVASSFAGLSTDYNELQNIPSGIISSSAQIDDLFNIDGVVSGSSQVNFTGLSGISANIISASSDTAQVDMIINGGSISANLKGGVVSGSAQIVDVISSLNVYTASNDTTNSTQNSRLDQLSTETGSITTEQATQDNRLSNIEGFTASLDTDLATLSVPANTTISTFGKSLVDDADAATARTTLGVDVSGTDNSTDVTLVGSYDYITIIGQVITRNQITNDDLAGSIANAKLANSTITINGNSTALGGSYSVTKSDVGLGNVTNESKATMFTNAALTGTPTAPTQTGTDDSTKIATTAFVQDRIDAIIGNAGSTLDTLGELSASLANDQDALTSLTTTVGTKLAKSSNLSDLTNVATARQNLGVEIGVDVQAYNATLAAVAGGTYTGDDSITTVGTIGTGIWQGTAIAHDYIGLDAIDGTNISDNAINSEHYTDGSIDRVHLSADIIDGTKLADDAVNSEHIADGAVDNVHLAGSIAASKITEISNLTADEGAQLENIGTTTISATQWGYLGAMNQGVTTTSSVTFASVSSTGDVIAYASSDERLKDNIELISNPIEKVQSLKGVTWNWNENADELQQSLPNVGVIAQDVEKVLPQLVHDRDNGFKGVDYAKLTGLLIEAIKEQQKQIDDLKSKLG